MVLKDFYAVIQQSGPEQEISASGIPAERYRFSVELNPAHPVYDGHFSGNPVVPGVCQVQIISELLSRIKGTGFRLVEADNVKFLSLIVPDKNRILEADLRLRNEEDGQISVNASLQGDGIVFIKFKGLYREE